MKFTSIFENRRWFNFQTDEDDSCITCHKFVIKNELNIFFEANNMGPDSQPDALKILCMVNVYFGPLIPPTTIT